MCLPVLALAGIAASVAGAGMNYLGQKKADSAMNSTFNRERKRQKAFEAEQVGKFQDSLNSTQDVTDPRKMAEAAAARQHELQEVTKSAAPAAEGYLPGSSSAPSIVQTAAAQAGAKADANTANLAAALGRIGGVGDQMQTNNINIGRNSSAIDQLTGFKSGSLGVLDAEMTAAQQKGSTLRTLGSLAQTIGSAMSMGAGGIGGMSAGAQAGATAGANAGMGSMFTAMSPSSGGIFGKLMPLVH